MLTAAFGLIGSWNSKMRTSGTRKQTIARAAGTSRAPRYVSLGKQPDVSYNGRTAIEVAWQNENVAILLDEVQAWAHSGRNTIGAKLWFEPAVCASVLVLAQSSMSSEVRVWRFGPSARTALVYRTERSNINIVECAGPAAVFPGEWFCTSRRTRGLPPPAVVWSLTELGLQMADFTAHEAMDRAADAGNHSEAQRIHAELMASEGQHDVDFARAELEDIRQAVGIQEELRERLLAEKEDELALLEEGSEDSG